MMGNWFKLGSLFLLIIVLMIARLGDWNHAILSILAISTLRDEKAISRITQDASVSWSDDPSRPGVCPATLAFIGAGGSRGIALNLSTQRLVRFVSLACEDDGSAIKRFYAQLATGYSTSEFDVLYMPGILDRNGFSKEATELQESMPDLSLRYVDLGRIAIEQLNDETRGLAYFALANQIAPEFDPRKAAMYRQLCLIGLRSEAPLASHHSCEDFNRALPSALSRVLLGRSYYNQQAYPQAITWLNDAIKLNPALGDAYYWLGKSWLSLGQAATAADYFIQGLHHEPAYPWNYLELARLKLQQGCISQAQMYLDQMNLIPDEAAIAAANQMLQAVKQSNSVPRNCQ
jgi:tetratricopeptide (TPR) repeat protein